MVLPVHTHRSARGFSLIEVLIVVAIVGLLAAVALPNYTEYVQRSKIIEATTGLSDFRTRMEQYFLDNRTYLAGAACGINPATVLKNVKTFTVTCVAAAGPPETYLATAAGKATEGMTGFAYTINEGNNKVTTGVPTGWTAAAACWTTRKDGTCN